jgi:hypothetical protein
MMENKGEHEDDDIGDKSNKSGMNIGASPLINGVYKPLGAQKYENLK